jgi:hypothetical protein
VNSPARLNMAMSAAAYAAAVSGSGLPHVRTRTERMR